MKPLITRAFNASLDANPSKSKRGHKCVKLKEYRLMLKYICQYYDYWVAFGRGKKDRFVSLDDFTEAIPILQVLGY